MVGWLIGGVSAKAQRSGYEDALVFLPADVLKSYKLMIEIYKLEMRSLFTFHTLSESSNFSHQAKPYFVSVDDQHKQPSSMSD